MSAAKSHRIWRASICLGLLAIAALVLGFYFEQYFFLRHDPFHHRAYLFGGSVASLSALGIGIGIRGVEVRANKAGCAIGIILSTLALLTSALFLLGTILPGD